MQHWRAVNPGDLVTVLYETKRYYIILEQLPRDDRGFSEQTYKLLGLKDGVTRHVRYSEIKVISKAEVSTR